MRTSTPYCFWKKRFPSNSERTCDSPSGMFRSGSTHMPPTTSHRPSLILFLISSFISGYLSAIHSLYCAADCV